LDASAVEEFRAPRPCPVCGEVHLECSENVLDGMSLMAYWEAKRHLSAEGMEALRMVEHAIDALGFSDAWELAENVEALSTDEVRVIEVFLARKTLIDAARKELYEEQS
jgi:hypothetical protein